MKPPSAHLQQALVEKWIASDGCADNVGTSLTWEQQLLNAPSEAKAKKAVGV